ncbi:hypothetical protein [Micromonospora sp. NBC_00617]|uniref:hypothetical protein n=1 Tax=Micromonospora sp. NBC_00617 TaxID=2903587 RepID=UPI0030E295BC
MMVSIALAVTLAWWFLVLPDAWDGVRAIGWGVPGSAAVTCEESTAARDPQFWTLGWTCAGPFTSNTGDFHLDSVRLFMHGDEPPGPTVAGRVSGPGAEWMWPDGEIEWAFAVALAIGLPILAVYPFNAAIDLLEPLNGWPKPRRKPRDGPPQMGNRARRRRRKRRPGRADAKGTGRVAEPGR